MCWKLPSTLRLSRFAFASTHAAAMFTTTPAAATMVTARPATCGGCNQARDRLVGHDDAEHEQDSAVGLPAQHLRPTPAVGQRLAARTLDVADDEDRQRQGAGVRQHVRGIREQRQGMRHDADDDFDCHEGDDEHERDRQVAPVRVGVDAVRVAGAPMPVRPCRMAVSMGMTC